MKINIEIDENLRNFTDYVSVKVITDSGATADEYQMTLENLVESLDASGVLEEDRPIPSPTLPKNCFKHVWVSIKNNVHDIYIEIPKRQWDVNFAKEDMNIGFPRMIFKWRVNDNQIDRGQLQIFAIKETGRITEKTEVFCFPFSHVQADGSVCMGANVFPKIKDIWQLETMHMKFITAPFSGDYGTRNTAGMNIRQIFEACKKKPFNDEWLVTTKKTIGEIFSW